MGVTHDTPEGTVVRWRDRAGRWAFGQVHTVGRKYAVIVRGPRVMRIPIADLIVWTSRETSTNDETREDPES